MAVSLGLSKVLDRASEDKLLDEILSAPPSALARLTKEDDAMLASAFNVRTVRDLGTNKFFAVANERVAVSNKL